MKKLLLTILCLTLIGCGTNESVYVEVDKEELAQKKAEEKEFQEEQQEDQQAEEEEETAQKEETEEETAAGPKEVASLKADTCAQLADIQFSMEDPNSGYVNLPLLPAASSAWDYDSANPPAQGIAFMWSIITYLTGIEYGLQEIDNAFMAETGGYSHGLMGTYGMMIDVINSYVRNCRFPTYYASHENDEMMNEIKLNLSVGWPTLLLMAEGSMTGYYLICGIEFTDPGEAVFSFFNPCDGTVQKTTGSNLRSMISSNNNCYYS